MGWRDVGVEGCGVEGWGWVKDNVLESTVVVDVQLWECKWIEQYN